MIRINNFKDVRIKAISAAVPDNVYPVSEYPFLNAEEKYRIHKTLLASEKRYSKGRFTTFDLCLEAAKKIYDSCEFDPADLIAVVSVTQTPDYPSPGNSYLVQEKLGLSEDVICIDILAGCTGYVSGLFQSHSILSCAGHGSILLLAGETNSIVNFKDKTSFPIMGEAGTATLLSYNEKDTSPATFSFRSFGAGHKSIYIPDGGARSPVTETSIQDIKGQYGAERKRTEMHMDGESVMHFAIKEVQEHILEFLEVSGLHFEDFASIYFHQANGFILDMMKRKMKISPSLNIPLTFSEYGNTSSASIPLGICKTWTRPSADDHSPALLIGFGVGLSSAIASVHLDDLINLGISDLACS